jgi:two-component system alkaline phosphatase synthesis response regulator PhoP
MIVVYCVEDDDNIRELVSYALRGQGYQVYGFSNSEDFYKQLSHNLPDLVLLDIMLPGEDGLSILKGLRSREETARVPVIMMTAKSSEFDIVKGLDMGADDYVTKPFGIMELLSRIRSVLRRSQKNVPSREDKSVLTYGNIVVDKKQHTVKVNGEEVNLTLKEFELLCYLILNKGIVLSREQIMQAVWDSPFALESRTIDMHIMSLRQKLGKEGKAIRTVRGVGYRLGDKK